MKILIFTANYGNGHRSVANACQNYFSNQNDEVVIKNPHYKLCKPITILVEKVYLNIFNKWANIGIINKLYGWSFETFGNSHTTIFSKYGSRTMQKIVAETEADLVILTFPFYCRDLGVPTYSVITDYGFSNIWYSNNVDKYLVASEQVKQDLLKFTSEEKIYMTGIPVGQNFADNNLHTKVRKVALNLGAVGGGRSSIVEDTINQILALNLEVELICGNNKRLSEKMTLAFKDDKRVTVHGFINDVYNVYRRCDILVSKAGGVTLAEAINCEIPLIINESSSLAGQEQLNIDFVMNMNIGSVCEHHQIVQYIKKYCDDPAIFTTNVKNMKDLKTVYRSELERLYDESPNGKQS